MSSVIIVIGIALLATADQMIKALIIRWIMPQGSVVLIRGVLQFHYIENNGAAFSFLSTSDWGRWFFIALTSVSILAGFVCLLSKSVKNKYPVLKSKIIILSLVLIISGGIGNLIDRIFRGIVIDYIELLFIHFAVFNFADCLLTIGAFILILYLIYDTISDLKNKKQECENG